jgi:hypothetical protein
MNNMKKEFDKIFDDMEIIKKVFTSYKKMEIDDYAIDMHTSAGRKMGKNKVDFIASGAVIVDEDKEYFVKEWRDCYNKAKMASFAAAVALRQKKEQEKLKKENKKKEKKEEVKKSRTEIRAEKYKRIKKMRGKPNFDFERKLDYYSGHFMDTKKIRLCTDLTCGNKVMCFEYEGKIWKEGRKSMNYNRDYCVLDECKELFGLKKIGMKRVITDFRIEKFDKSKKSWVDNWRKVIIEPGIKPVVYCVMNKITHCNWKVPMEIGVIKHSFPSVRRQLKEFVKIGVFRGIFRCSDFNCRNVLVGCEKSYLPQYFVSIDEGDIGKRLDILGGRERWLINKLNEDKTIINEIRDECFGTVGKVGLVMQKMKEYKFSDELCDEVIKNWKNLRKDLESEGVEFD